MQKLKAGIVGATGMVGQRFAVLLAAHPMFEVAALAASSRSAGKTYAAAANWKLETPMPEKLKDVTVLDTAADFDKIVNAVDFVFCAVDMPKDAIRALEEKFALAECPVISNNSAHRWTPDVPMLLPEINPESVKLIDAQRARLGTKRGFIAVKPNCSVQSYVPLIYPLLDMGIADVKVCTYQAVSGAGKTLAEWTEMNDNVIPFIGGEEEKSEREPRKILGEDICPPISAQCIRVPVSDGHLAAVFAEFKSAVDPGEIISRWENFKSPIGKECPSAPEKFIYYFREENFPQTKLHRGLENGMAVSAGRLRVSDKSVRFIGLSHNTLRGAAGGAVLMAEFLKSRGYLI